MSKFKLKYYFFLLYKLICKIILYQYKLLKIYSTEKKYNMMMYFTQKLNLKNIV